tara:strand:- start:106 stop:516 length:411 start_codon:yes stop_codon:yes gene_type:complete
LQNRKLESQQGIICSLTEKQAAFKHSCKDYKVDNPAIYREKVYREESRLRSRPKDFRFGLDKIGIKNGIVSGSILIILEIAWIIFELAINRIFWYPFLMLLMGLISLTSRVVNTLISSKIDKDHKKIRLSMFQKRF